MFRQYISIIIVGYISKAKKLRIILREIFETKVINVNTKYEKILYLLVKNILNKPNIIT